MGKDTFVIIIALFCPLNGVLLDICSMSETHGMNWLRDADDCSSVHVCLFGRVVTYGCPDGFVIGSDTLTCVPIGSPLDDCSGTGILEQEEIEMESDDMRLCKEGEMIPHDDNCAAYFQCVTLPDGNSTFLQQECSYPNLFDIKSRKCENYKNAACVQGQHVPKSPCDYRAYQCTSAHCIPCNIRFPTCTGLSDGMHPWLGREWSPDYVICNEERVVRQEQCKGERQQQVFHPGQKACVTLDDKTLVG